MSCQLPVLSSVCAVFGVGHFVAHGVSARPQPTVIETAVAAHFVRVGGD